MKIYKRNFSIIAAITAAFIVGLATISNAQGYDPKDRVNTLTTELRQVTAQELAAGEKVSTERGTYLTGQSAEKVARLHREAARAFQATLARPEQARIPAIANIKAFAEKSDLNVQYKSTAKSSYNSEVIAEFYVVDQDVYEVDTRNNQIIQFGPMPVEPGVAPKVYDTESRYNSRALETLARAFIAKRTRVDLTTLTPHHGNKESITFFFRWEDRTQLPQDGRYPFIQVGFTRGGDLLSYTNSLGM